MVFYACGKGTLTVDKDINKSTKDVVVYDTDDLSYEKTNGTDMMNFVFKNQEYFKPFYNDESKVLEKCTDYAVLHSNLQFYRHENLMLIFALKGVCCIYISPERHLYVNGKKYLDDAVSFSNPYNNTLGDLVINFTYMEGSSEEHKTFYLEDLMCNESVGVSCSDLVVYKRKAEIELDSALNYMLEVVDVSSFL